MLKNREIDASYLCLQQFEKLWMWSAGNRKRKLCKFAETNMEKLMKSLWVNFFSAGLNYMEPLCVCVRQTLGTLNCMYKLYSAYSNQVEGTYRNSVAHPESQSCFSAHKVNSWNLWKSFFDSFPVKLQQWHCSSVIQNLVSFGFYSFLVFCVIFVFSDLTKKMSSKMRRTPLFGFDGNLGIPIIPSKSKQPSSTSNSTSSSSNSVQQKSSSSSGKQKSNTKFGSYSVPHTDYSNSKVGFEIWQSSI